MPADASPPSSPDDSWADKDAFVSYCTKDGAWVLEELLPALVANGITYTIDREHFPVGGDLDALIETAAKRARKTIAVLTPAYLDSPYCRFENRLLAELDPEAAQLRLVPILLEECALPERWKSIVYVKMLKVADRAEALRKVLSAVKGGAVVVPARISVRSLAEFFSEPAVRQLADAFKDDIERITASFDDLEGYKNLHEALHQAMGPRRELELRKDALKAAQTPDAWKNVAPPLKSFVSALSGVCREVEDSQLADNEWTAVFMNAVEVLPKALTTANFQLFCLEVEATLFHLDTVPTALNQLLKLKSEGLRLEELFRLLDTIRAEIRKLTLSPDATALFDDFQKQTDTLAERSKALPTFISAHAQLQIITNAMRPIDPAQIRLDLLRRGWKVTGAARTALRKVGPPENAFWFDDLGAREQVLDAALGPLTADAAALSDPFSNYLQTLDNAFTQTDVDMRRLLKKLNRFSDEMKDALTQMMIPPTS